MNYVWSRLNLKFYKGTDNLSEDSYKWWAFWAIGLSLVTNVMSFSIVFLALSSIADDFGVTLRSASWIVIAQSLTISAVMLPLGRVSDIIGRKKFHLMGLIFFGGGSIFAALSQDLGTLISARVVMAVGGAMGQAVSTAIITSVFPSRERGKAMGSQSTAVAIGMASGPIVAGLLLQIWNWQALFIFLSIATVIAFFCCLYILDDDRIGSAKKNQRLRYDWWGAILSAIAMVVLIVTINNPFNLPIFSTIMVLGSAIAIILFGIFVWWELKTESPMVDLRLFRNTVYRYAIITRLVAFMSTTSTVFIMPIFLQSVRGTGEAVTGAIMFVSALGMGIAAQASGRLSDKLGYRRFTFMGFVILIGTSLTFSTFEIQTSFFIIAPILFLNGIGMGLWSAPNMSATMGAVDNKVYGSVSAFANLTRNVGNVTGQAIIASIVTGVMISQGFDIQLGSIKSTLGAEAAFMSGWRFAYFTAAGFGVLALIAAFLTRSPSKSK